MRKRSPFMFLALVAGAVVLAGEAAHADDAGVKSDAGAAKPPADKVAVKPTVKVSGNKLVDGSGAHLRLRGANYAGTEYACVQGWGIFSGPGDDAMVAAMEKWKINAVRVPLNEDCWLGIKGVSATWGGKAYRDAIGTWVTTLHKHGIVAILDLHWAAPGTHKAGEQQPMANADHSIEFWKSVATTFKDDPGVIYDLFNEPYLNHAKLSTDAWSCWLSGCTVDGGDGGLSGKWQSAGMQQMIDAVRAAGSKQPVMVGGLEWSNDLTGFLTHLPKDPEKQMIAAFHQYQGNACGSDTCWKSTLAAIAAKLPLVTGELGEDDCGHAFTDSYMDWADGAGVSYLMWTWNAWGNPSATSCGTMKFPLIADWNGTPTPYGIAFKARLAK